jgi:hypothetical protein
MTTVLAPSGEESWGSQKRFQDDLGHTALCAD